jgi:hypothetical protein
MTSICSHDNEFFLIILYMPHLLYNDAFSISQTKHLPPLLLKLNNSAHSRLETMLES